MLYGFVLKLQFLCSAAGLGRCFQSKFQATQVASRLGNLAKGMKLNRDALVLLTCQGLSTLDNTDTLACNADPLCHSNSPCLHFQRDFDISNHSLH